ncbi:MAG: phosphotransferase family protein [Actinomycetota bacterium]
MGLSPASLEPIVGDEIRDLVRLPGGASRETWSFNASSRKLVLRRDPPGSIVSGIGMQMEAKLIAAAREAGVPAPAVVASGADLDGGAFMILEHIEGETIARRVLRNVRDGEALLSECAIAIAKIHSMPVIEGLEHHDPLSWARNVLDEAPSAHPAFELAIRWLQDRRPASLRTTVVHGDFRLGNWIVEGDHLRAVLDWELAHIGDPIEDLGWMCVKSWRFGSPLAAAGLGTRDQLRRAYEDSSRIEVDPDALAWWEVMGTLRWGVICILQASRHLSGAERSVELAAIGRRVCEVEYDILELIA